MAVGVFDSGIGGLTVLDAVQKRLPEEAFVYFGDHAHSPYGVRDADDIHGLTKAAVERLWDEGCDLVILACNTASAAALRRMQEAGYELQEGHMSAVDGSKDAILEEMADHERVYFCTSVFKDAAQHRNRLKRMAENIRRPFDEVTDDGTLVYGKTWLTAAELDALGVPEEFYTVKSDHVEVAWWLLEEMVEEGDAPKGEIVEQYPTVDGTVVERTPLA